MNRGNSIEGIGCIPTGGNSDPISMDGQRDAWKKAQKNPKNNINSETINNKKPNLKPWRTALVWNPKWVASSTISANHPKAHKIKQIKPKTKNHPPKYTLCI